MKILRWVGDALTKFHMSALIIIHQLREFNYGSRFVLLKQFMVILIYLRFCYETTMSLWLLQRILEQWTVALIKLVWNSFKVIVDCSHMDLPYIMDIFTWCGYFLHGGTSEKRTLLERNWAEHWWMGICCDVSLNLMLDFKQEVFHAMLGVWFSWLVVKMKQQSLSDFLINCWAWGFLTNS